MKQAFKYGLKVWATTIGIAIVIAFIFLCVNHQFYKHFNSQDLDPFVGTLGLIAVNVVFVPAWLLFSISIPLVNRKVSADRRRACLYVVAALLVIATFVPFLILDTGYRVYLIAAGIYIVAIIISISLYRQKPVIDEAPSTISLTLNIILFRTIGIGLTLLLFLAMLDFGLRRHLYVQAVIGILAAMVMGRALFLPPTTGAWKTLLGAFFMAFFLMAFVRKFMPGVH